MAKTFKSWDVDQLVLLPPSVQELVPAGHLAHFVRDLVRDSLDVSAVLKTYDEDRGFPPYDPTMMVALLLYAYSQGLYASRRIAKACQERVDFMAVTARQSPDFRTISDFRKRHLSALGGLFTQVLQLGQKAGLASLGHVALDGTKIRANASKDKARSYSGMKPPERARAAEVAPRRILQALPPDRAQRNCTDPDSRIMKTPDGFIQGYNAQAAVDAAHQVIVAQGLTNQASDAHQLEPMLAHIRSNTGRQARELSADAGDCSEHNLTALARRNVRGYVATGRQQHGEASATGARKTVPGTRVHAMKIRLKRAGHRRRYRLRKQVVEPVFGQIKQARGFRQFLLRGLSQVAGEWSLVCSAHNVLKLAGARG